MENYRKISSQTAIPLATTEAKVKSKQEINLLIVLGGIILISSLGSSIYFYYQLKIKSGA